MTTYDAIIVGGGPAGSTCARTLVKGGFNVLILDKGNFPRVKLCAGWLSPPVWQVLQVSPRSYPLGLWEWNRGHVHYAGKTYTVRLHGYFIRRYEFDHFLLKRSGATVVEGRHVREMERDMEGYWVIDQQYRAKYLVGAGGTQCPVARALFPKKIAPPVTTQEREFEEEPEDIAECRIGGDGEPEILLHDDLKGYSWNIPKTAWLNVGSGTLEPRAILAAWRQARRFFRANDDNGHLPVGCDTLLDQAKGHAYYLFHPAHLTACHLNNVFLIGDALGLAHPLTGEGILPAVLSGRICGEVILAGMLDKYRQKLEGHPLIRDYKRLQRGRERGFSLMERIGMNRLRKLNFLIGPFLVRFFAYFFSGKPLRGRQLAQRLARMET